MLTSYDLIHRDSEGPHVRLNIILLEADHFWGPVDKGVWHCLGNQDLAKELVSVPSCIKFNFADFTK